MSTRKKKGSRSSSKSNSRNLSRADSINSEQPGPKVVVQTKDINAAFKNKKRYDKGGVILAKWEGANDLKYLGKVEKDKIDYVGAFSRDLKRDGLGKSVFENGDKYFGNWKDDRLSRHGFYAFEPELSGNKKIYQYYWGFYKGGMKDGRGINMIVSEDKDVEPLTKFDDSNLDIYFGSFDNNNYKKGLYLKKEEDKYEVYYGEFDSKGKKTGNNCFYYDALKDSVMYGKVEQDNFVEGYYSVFDEDGKISDILKCEFENNKISNYETMEELEGEEGIEDIRTKITNFRSVLLEGDIFGDLYKKFKENVDFLKTIKDIPQFESEEFYPKMNSFTSDYNSFKILADVERNVE